MIKERETTVYSMTCDNCGWKLTDTNNNLEFFSEENLKPYYDFFDWKKINDKDYCPDCWDKCGTEYIVLGQAE